MSGYVKLKVSRSDKALRLADFLAARLGLTKRAAKAILDERRALVNRRAVWMAKHELKAGDEVEVPRPANSSKANAPAKVEKLHIRVLLETPDYIICDKPAGMLTNAGGAKCLEERMREQTGITTLKAVHRLDRDTSGCLILAKTRQAYEGAVEIFKTHRVRKTYAAIVAGGFPYRHQTIEQPLDGRRACTNITLQRSTPGASLLRVSIETGRTNQIRRHLAQVRFPVVGDRLFGLKNARDVRLMTPSRQMLHATDIEFPNPMVSGETIKVHSPLPADFRSTLRLFGL